MRNLHVSHTLGSRQKKLEIPRDCFSFVYYESRKRELKTRPIHECRCDEKFYFLFIMNQENERLLLVVYYESRKRELKIRCI